MAVALQVNRRDKKQQGAFAPTMDDEYVSFSQGLMSTGLQRRLSLLRRPWVEGRHRVIAQDKDRKYDTFYF